MKSYIIRKNKLNAGKPWMGVWLSLGSPVVAEICAKYKFDWILLDLEHGCTTESDVLPILQAVSGDGVTVIVRVPDLQPALIGRVLDWGAAGIMMPHVRSAEDAAKCVAAMRFAPQGGRGYSSSSRVFGYGVTEDKSLERMVPPVFLAQIECGEGVRNASSIAAVDGVDCLFIGPTDLRLALKGEGDFSEEKFESAVNSVISAADSAGIVAGTLLPDETKISAALERGIWCIAAGSDMKILRNGYAQIRKAMDECLESRK